MRPFTIGAAMPMHAAVVAVAIAAALANPVVRPAPEIKIFTARAIAFLKGSNAIAVMKKQGMEPR
jgi:hypothetical protein